MIKMVNEETKRMDFLTIEELSKVIDCVLLQMQRYENISCMCLSDDNDIMSSIDKAKRELREIINSLSNVEREVINS